MKQDDNLYLINNIQNYIYLIRWVQVILDRDLALLYGVQTKVLNQAVKRNISRFPNDFRFQLTEKEFKEINNIYDKKSLRSQTVTLEKGKWKHRKYLPYVFTEQWIAMLSWVLKSKIAITISIKIMNSFVEMRKNISNNKLIYSKLEKIEQKQIEDDEKFKKLFDAFEYKVNNKQWIFYNGQIFDAYIFIIEILKSAKKSIILIDNYIDESVLNLLTKRKKDVKATIYTKNISKILKQDLEKHNKQYDNINIKICKKFHDRFIIIDENTVYHIGASIKDLGKKIFAFSKLQIDTKKLFDWYTN